MITFLLMLFGSGGGVAIGSALKTVSGMFESASHRRETKENREIIRDAKDAKSRLQIIKAIYGDEGGSQTGSYSTHTRRMLALIAVGTLALVTIHCVICQSDPFVTLPSVATTTESGRVWVDFYFFKVYKSDKPIQLTLGHLALMNLGSLQMVLGFYFGGGRSR